MREKAERDKAEREKAEREKAEREKEKKTVKPPAKQQSDKDKMHHRQGFRGWPSGG